MKIVAVVLILLCAGIMVSVVAPPAMAVMTNQGIDRTLPTTPTDLTPGVRGDGRILYAPSEADDAAFRAAIALVTGGVVDYFDASVATPDAALLATYDCVYTWANYAYANNVLFGDRLADYVDGGGSVVLGVFCTYTSGNELAGRIMTSGYCPVISPLGNNHFSSSVYIGDGTTCIHLGVSAYECFYRDYLVVQGGGIADGHYADGEIGHAYRPDFRVIYSNGTGAFPISGTGDWGRLVANACACTVPPVPAGETTWGVIKSIFR